MAASIDTTAVGASPLSITCTGAQLVLLLLIQSNPNQAPSSLSRNGTGFTQLGGSTTDPNSNSTLTTWYQINPATGAHNITASGGAGHNIRAVSITNAAQSNPFPAGLVTSSGLTEFGQSTVGATMTAGTGELTFGHAFHYGNVNSMNGTTIYQGGVQGAQYQTGAGSKTLNFTGNADEGNPYGVQVCTVAEYVAPPPAVAVKKLALLGVG